MGPQNCYFSLQGPHPSLTTTDQVRTRDFATILLPPNVDSLEKYPCDFVYYT